MINCKIDAEGKSSIVGGIAGGYAAGYCKNCYFLKGAYNKGIGTLLDEGQKMKARRKK